MDIALAIGHSHPGPPAAFHFAGMHLIRRGAPVLERTPARELACLSRVIAREDRRMAFVGSFPLSKPAARPYKLGSRRQ